MTRKKAREIATNWTKLLDKRTHYMHSASGSVAYGYDWICDAVCTANYEHPDVMEGFSEDPFDVLIEVRMDLNGDWVEVE